MLYFNLPVPRRSNQALLALSVASTLVVTPIVVAQTQAMDGFFAYCTSNMDATGVCINQETSKQLDCIVVPGAIIRCKTFRKKHKFECVWVSNVVAGGAQFWCDPKAEQALSTDLQSTFSDRSSPDATLGIPGPIQDQLLDDNVFSP